MTYQESAQSSKSESPIDLGAQLDLDSLVSHRNWVGADQTLGEVFQIFADHGFDYMGVLEGKSLLGLCAKRDLGMLLGSKYGFSLFAPRPIKHYLLPNPIRIKFGTPIQEVFFAVFAREGDTFFDDVLLVGQNEEFLGLIETQSLVKLQNQFHLESIRLLEKQGREIRLKNEQIEADLRICRELQRALLPLAYPRYPPRTPAGGANAFRLHHYYRPVGMVGGDFFHIKKVQQLVAGIFIADVMGHGVHSAVITAMLRAMLETLAPEIYQDPALLLGQINREFAKLLLQSASDVIYASALYVVADAQSCSLCFASAGHPLPIHVRGRMGSVETLDHPNPGTILGVFEQADFFNHIQPYEPGDSLIVYTDGIIEVENSMGKEFGLIRLREVLSATIGCPINQVLDELIARAGEFSASGQFSDDICLVGVDLG